MSNPNDFDEVASSDSDSNSDLSEYSLADLNYFGTRKAYKKGDEIHIYLRPKCGLCLQLMNKKEPTIASM